MSSPSNFSGRPTEDPAALGNGKARRTERRRRPPPSSPDEYLRALPASVLLDRIPVPMLATRLDGVVVYNNPAFATMLGHGPDVTLAGYGLPALLEGHSSTPPSDCVNTLRTANNVLVDWLHAEGFPVRSVISESLYIRAADQILLFGVTDLTELIWMYPPE
jgi:PAS domain-containing protein